MFGFSVCKPCGNTGDRQTDTVKVSFGPPAEAADKENAAPGPALAEAEEAEEGKRRLECEAQERRREEEERLRREQERLRLEALERQRAEEERRRQLEEQRAREAEELRQKKEAEEARRRAEEAKKKEQLEQFLSKQGFAGVNEKKKKSGILSSGFTYPLHAAVRAVDAEAAELLLWGGADKTLKDSAKLTPLALAQKLDKKGSHTLVADALSA